MFDLRFRMGEFTLKHLCGPLPNIDVHDIVEMLKLFIEANPPIAICQSVIPLVLNYLMSLQRPIPHKFGFLARYVESNAGEIEKVALENIVGLFEHFNISSGPERIEENKNI